MKRRIDHRTWVEPTHRNTKIFFSPSKAKRSIPRETQSLKELSLNPIFSDFIFVTFLLAHGTWKMSQQNHKGGATLLHFIPFSEPNLCTFFSHLVRWFGFVKGCCSCGDPSDSRRDSGWKSCRV